MCSKHARGMLGECSKMIQSSGISPEYTSLLKSHITSLSLKTVQEARTNNWIYLNLISEYLRVSDK